MAFFQDHALPGRCWRHGERTLTQIFDSLQHRVDQCMTESPALQQLSAEAGQLHKAMAAAEITDTRQNFAGERHRVLARASALKLALEAKDPTLRHVPWAAPVAQAAQKGAPPPPCVSPGEAPPPHPPSAVEEDEVSPYCALMSACLLQSALYEHTPYSDTDVRRRVFADYTTLKRDFRHTVTRTLHGPTTSVGELFGSIKDLDKQGLCDNIQGIIFDDWTVHRRVDCYLSSDLDVEATCLTQEGPIGRIQCRLRTFLVLALLQERLLRDLFAARFVPCSIRGCEAMTLDDPLDFYDFVEAMTRNTPNAYASTRGLYYAWLYAPEVNATPERWEQIFGGAGANRLPCLYDSITTPDDAVVVDPASDSGYSMDIGTATRHDYAEAGAQAAVGYPWADDLLGKFLIKLREARQQGQQQVRASCGDVKHGESKGGADQGCCVGAGEAGCARGGSVDEEQSEGTVVSAEGRVSPGDGCREGGRQEVEEMGSSDGEEPRAKRPKCEPQTAQELGRTGPTPAQQGDCAASGAESTLHPASSTGVKQEQDAGGCAAGPGPGSEATAAAAGAVRGPPDDRLHLPLGIFLVGIITSSAYTNTQIHIEDLMLMSININIFGAPKIWWWIPQANVPEFKEFAESLSGPEDLYTKAVAPFLLDKTVTPHEHRLPLSKLKEFGARRIVQMPGMAILTSPGYAFHFTVSMGLNIAESCNMFLEMMGWDVQRLWKERPLDQYPDPENSMAKWMNDFGVLSTLGVEPGVLHLPPRNPEDSQAGVEESMDDEPEEEEEEEEEEDS